jgi:hypothetical protein
MYSSKCYKGFSKVYRRNIMPMKSQAQRKMMWATDPKLAKEMESKTPKGKKLPKKVKKAKKK